MFLTNRYTLYAKRSQGFTLLLAVLASAILLTVSIAVAGFALKGSLLSNIAEQSQYAFYGADAGLECALYWDVAENAFDPDASVVTDALCFGQAGWMVGGGGSYSSTCGTVNCEIYTERFDQPGYCVDITVTKHDALLAGVITEISARGLSTCDNTDPRQVERALKVQY